MGRSRENGGERRKTKGGRDSAREGGGGREEGGNKGQGERQGDKLTHSQDSGGF